MLEEQSHVCTPETEDRIHSSGFSSNTIVNSKSVELLSQFMK